MSQHIVTRFVRSSDLAAISRLHAEVFGPGRFVRTAYRVRESKRVAGLGCTPYCRIALLGDRPIAAVRLTDITIGGEQRALLLGPLVVHPDFAGQGYGRQLTAEALSAAKSAGEQAVILVGDLPYYGRFGFKPVPAGQITLPGPVDPSRLLILELVPGSAEKFRGPVTAA